jgi:4-hydroxybenzoate polyprenyltransferase
VYGLRSVQIDWSYLLGFAVLIWPYFVSREASVEGPPESSADQAFDRAFFIPLVIFVIIASFEYFIAQRSIDPARLYGTRAALGVDGLLFLFFVTLLPFVYLGARTYALLKLTARAEEERRFKNKVLLPAVATCLISFSFGWALSEPLAGAICVTLCSAIIIGLKELVLLKDIRLVRLVSFVFLIVFIAFTLVWLPYSKSLSFPLASIGKVIIIGLILSFGMGVAEVCKRVVRYPDPKNNQHHLRSAGRYNTESYNFYVAGSNWSSIVFPLLLCFLPLLIEDFAIWPIFCILSIQYLHWHHVAKNKNNEGLFWFNVFLGYSLPLTLWLQYYMKFPSHLFHSEALGDLISYIGIPLGITLTIATLLRKDKVDNFLDQFLESELYLDPNYCFWLFVVVIYGMFVLIGLFAIIMHAGVGLEYVRLKATETISFLLLLLLVAVILYLYNLINSMDNHTGLPNANGDSPRPEPNGAADVGGHARSALLLFFKVGRFPVACIAGLVVFLILYSHSHISPWLSALHTIPICLVTMAGFALNDVFDLQKDKIGQANKPVALGYVSPAAALILALGTMALSLISAAALAVEHSWYVIVAAAIGVTLYSQLARHIPLAKGVATGILCCTPFAYGAEVASLSLPILTYVLIIAFIIGRELLLDVRDFAGDMRAGIRTWVAYLLPSTCRVIGWSLMICSVILATLYGAGLGKSLFVITFIALGVNGILYWRNENLGLAVSRVTLLIGVIAATLSL